jgi:hypothetical protein
MLKTGRHHTRETAHRTMPWQRRLALTWSRYGGTILFVVVAHALFTAALRLGYGFHLAVVKPDEPIDLLFRYEEVKLWFSGVMIYGTLPNADYPPGSYSLLWPMIGWLPQEPMRWMYGATAAVCMVLIALISVRASGANTLPTKLFMAVFLLPSGATQLTLWVGQLGLHVVASLLVATVLLVGFRGERPARTGAKGWIVDLIAAGMLAGSLVKPTMSVPAVVGILIVAGRWRPCVLVAVIYGSATAIAIAFQDVPPVTLLAAWLGQEAGVNVGRGSVNIHLWMHWLGVGGSFLPASLAVLAIGTLWAWRHRHIHPWIVIAVMAMVGRFWIHHRAYDDVVIVVAAIALFQFVAANSGAHRRAYVAAAVLLGSLYIAGHIPMWAHLTGAPIAMSLASEVYRTLSFVGVTGFFLYQAHRSLRTPAPEGTVRGIRCTT